MFYFSNLKLEIFSLVVALFVNVSAESLEVHRYRIILVSILIIFDICLSRAQFSTWPDERAMHFAASER